MWNRCFVLGLVTAVLPILGYGQESSVTAPGQRLIRLPYNHPGLTVDLGVGLWAQPLPMDYNGDGHVDLLAATNDRPYNGIYHFANPEAAHRFPVFQPGVRIGDAVNNITVSHVDGQWFVMTPGMEYPDFRNSGLREGVAVPYRPDFLPPRFRANQWYRVDYDGDGAADLVIGVDDWSEYGWDDAYNERGEWTRGPLRGYVYWVKNHGATDAPDYGEAEQVMAGGEPVDVYGFPSPAFADFDGDGDLDLICGEFLDKLTYFENIGTRTEPVYAPGRFIETDGKVLTFDLQMILVATVDWTGNGRPDLIVGEEDGRVALLENTGRTVDGMPEFLPPRHFQQEAQFVKVGALSTPYGVDWDGDGYQDLIAGDTAGYISFVKNLDGGNPPKWARPVYLEAEGEVIRIQAGENGSIQGPAEAKWGYTVLSAADWNHDGLPDIIVNSIWGAVHWYENIGTRTEPKLAAAKPITVDWPSGPPKPAWVWWTPEDNQLITQWRTTPYVIDLFGNGLNDLVMLDHEGYLAFYERVDDNGELRLLPGKRIFLDAQGEPLRLNDGWAGRSGRRKIALADWDGDGKIDLLVNSQNADFYRNVSNDPSRFVFENQGPVAPRVLAGHTTSPAFVDWNNDGIPDLIIGAEDGHFYYMENPRRKLQPPPEAPDPVTAPGGEAPGEPAKEDRTPRNRRV